MECISFLGSTPISFPLLFQRQTQAAIPDILVRKREEGPFAEPLSEPGNDIDAVVGQWLSTQDDLGNRRTGRRNSGRVQAGLLHGAELVPYFFDERLPGRPVQLGLMKPVTDEICCDASLAIAIKRGRLAMFDGAVQAGFGTSGEFVGR